MIAIVVNVTFLLPLFVVFLMGYAPTEIAAVILPVLPIIVAICIPLLFFYFNGKLRQFYLRQFWENAPNFLQCFNPDHVNEINNSDR